MAKKYYNANETIQIVNPQDSELKRSYTTTTISGEGDNQTVTTEEHSGYATFQGWNTNFYGVCDGGKDVVPGPHTLSELAKSCGSHLIRLYDKWAGKECDITYDKGDFKFNISHPSDNSQTCAGIKLPAKGLTRYNFGYWEVPSRNSKVPYQFQAEQCLLLDENILSLSAQQTKYSLTITARKK